MFKNPKYDGYQRGLSSMVYKFFDKKSAGGDVNIPLELWVDKGSEFYNNSCKKMVKR